MSDNIRYQDIDLTNDTPYAIPAYVFNRQDTAILDDPAEWEVSIVKFQISTQSIPLFFPTIEDPLFPTRTNKSVTLQYAGDYFRTFVNVTLDEAKNGIFFFQKYIDDINIAFQTSFTALKAIYPASSGTIAPKIFLNPVTGLISLYVQDSYLDSNANRIYIGVNQQLQQLLNFPSTLVNQSPHINGYEYLISVGDAAISLFPVPRYGFPNAITNAAGNYLEVQQEFKNLDEWNGVQSIIFTSQMLPIAKEYYPNKNGTVQSSSIQDAVLPVLSDFTLNTDANEPTRHRALYLPTAEYRMASLVGHTAFTSIDITASYKTFNGLIKPIYLFSGSNMSMKVMFRRKVKI